ncbi:MAG TPA: GAF domain-containing protein, partial [Thermoanaerobaculia bacterium]|nr:GAF domain-containing protein [Thermoanaerobaculia bacterium]
MSNQVLIAAAGAAARASAEVARSLRLKPVVAASEKDALERLDEGPFRLIAVGSTAAWKRVRDAAASKQPAAAILDLPDANGNDAEIRGLMLRHLEPPRSGAHFSEERYRFLSSILESFTTPLELKEVLRRLVTITREELHADRGWLVRSTSESWESGTIAFATVAPGVDKGAGDRVIPLSGSRAILERAMKDSRPIVIDADDPNLDRALAARYGAQSTLLQILRPRGAEPWAFGLHHGTERKWTEEEIDLFMEIGRYATLALNNSLLHTRAVREMAKVNAILDQIPEAAAIYDAAGKLERMNTAAQRDPIPLFNSDTGVRELRHRAGVPVGSTELPSIRALSGESVRADYVFPDARSGDERIVAVKAAPIRDDGGRIIGSVLLSRDVTEERQNTEREGWRRRRAECLASLGLENVTVQANFDNLDETARRVAEAIQGTVRIYLYRPAAGLLEMVGYESTLPGLMRFRDYYAQHPFRPGEGLAGTVFQIGRPLLFYEVRGNSMVDFARDEEERQVKTDMNERSVIACPIESYGDRIGAIVISQSDPRRNFDAEDLEFVQSLADRIGAAAHIHRLTRIAQEGHRAAEELARQEVDARVRFEAVLENAPVGIAVISADELRFDLANARFIDFALGFGKVSPDTRIIGLRVAEVVPGFERTLKQIAERGESRTDDAIEITVGNETKYFNRIISAVRGRFSGITQNLTVLLQDVTEQVVEERQNADREAWRRRRAECLAGLGLETVAVQPFFEDLDEPARRVAEAIGGSAMVYLYHQPTSELHMVGFGSVAENAERYRQYREYLSHNPYHVGEGLPGTVFQIGRPLMFADVRGNAVVDFGRADDERAILAGLSEESLIACPIESYGDRIGALVIARSDSRRNFDAEDLEFAQSLADRIGAAAHIHRLTKIAQEGHRAAEELARREVDARVRLEAVLETAPIGIAVVSADELRFDLANARFIEFASQVGKIPPDTKLIGLGIADVRLGLAGIVKQVAE